MTRFFARSLTGFLLLFVAVCGSTAAHEYTLGGLTVVHPWMPATPEGATTGAGYLTLTNSGATPMRLTGATTAVAARVEMHVMSVDGGVMRMRPIDGVDIAPGATVTLKPGGSHLMLIGLRKPLLREDMVPMTLVFAGGKTLAVEFYVEAMGAGHGAHEH
jgi:periplasmic copper chaperone A